MSAQGDGNVLYAQSGGVSAVINATAAGLIDAVLADGPERKIFAARNGILGALQEELIDIAAEDPAELALLHQTPGGAFGSCRFKLPDADQDERPYRRLREVFRAHGIGHFFYNGGNDSQDTTNKIDAWFRAQGHPLNCIGLPKTVDNDLAGTDNCPGFGSVAKYIAVSVRECALDVASMCATSTKVFILEVMGRHAGWITAAGALARSAPEDAPHLLLFPEVAFDPGDFIARVRSQVERSGYCVVVASEGIRTAEGEFLAAAGGAGDAFGHAQLGGVAPHLAHQVQEAGLKTHWATADYLQRAARHIASGCDVEQACALGRSGWQLARTGASGVMLGIRRLSDAPYRWEVEPVELGSVANLEKCLPENFRSADGYDVTPECLAYLRPLVLGEAAPSYNPETGLPNYARLKCRLAEKKLPDYQP
ncbi:MAG: 6-phosphofructokinase [Gammaproteobacteria bacterium AqS3]|nr:6-phosphofructokinase [Gammaproteobacteria bacterium AqS3]